MIHCVFSIYDVKAEAFLTPLFFRTKGEAVRAFSAAANDAEHQFGKYAEDYVLFQLATFDDSSAKFVMEPAPLSIGSALEYKKS